MAGYNAEAVAMINKIVVPLDWDNARVLEPTVEVINPIPGRDPTWKFNAGCAHDAISSVTKKEGIPYARARQLELALLDKLFAAQDFTIDEAKRLVMALITVESEFTPAVVGLPVQIVVIEKPTSTPR